MVMRVTNLTQQRSALNNIFRITEDLFNAQKEITSGKQIHKPSDDPAGMRDTLALRTSLKQIKQFDRNINSNKISMINSDCKFLSVKATKPSLINVKKVTIPIKIQRNEDKIIQLKFLIILNILNKH